MEPSKGTLVELSRAVLICFLFILILIPELIRAEARDGRFFLTGDGRVHIKNTRTGQEASVSLTAPDGSLSEEGFTRIDEVFEFPTKEKGEHISPRLIFMLDHFSDLVAPGKVINLDSGYRSSQYNDALRNSGKNAAKTSTHIDGMAIDFHIEGVNGKELWNLIRSKECCGVGHYGGANVHLDSARPRFWEAATSKVRTGESDRNRRIYLSTDYDRYRAGDAVRLSLSSVSDLGFGIKPTVAFVNGPEGSNTVATAQIGPQGAADCVMIQDRNASRFIHLNMPPNLHQGKYKVRIDFCRSPFEQMPSHTLSNEIELIGNVP